MGPRTQKFLLASSAVFALCATVYALVVSILCLVKTGSPFILIMWAIVAVAIVPILVKMLSMAWKLVDKHSKT